jgi:hypothetical protein
MEKETTPAWALLRQSMTKVAFLAKGYARFAALAQFKHNP